MSSYTSFDQYASTSQSGLPRVKKGTGTALLPYITHKEHQKTLAKVQSQVSTGIQPTESDIQREQKKEQFQLS